MLLSSFWSLSPHLPCCPTETADIIWTVANLTAASLSRTFELRFMFASLAVATPFSTIEPEVMKLSCRQRAVGCTHHDVTEITWHIDTLIFYCNSLSSCIIIGLVGRYSTNSNVKPASVVVEPENRWRRLNRLCLMHRVILPSVVSVFDVSL